MWSKLGNQSKSSTAVEVDFLNHCKDNVRIVEDFVDGGNLLNQRQCQDLSFKLLKIIQNIRECLLHCKASAVDFRPALGNLYRYLEEAKVLVSKCGEEDWCTAAVFQVQNENAFREILLDVGLCYNAIYEQAKSTREGSNVLPEDLRQSSLFRPAIDSIVLLDQQDLQQRLEDLANEPSSSKRWDHFLPGRGALKACLARYLLVTLRYTTEQSHATTLDAGSAILWAKESEPPGTWGKKSRFLGAGGGASGVCKTKWMGIRCAKKEFHRLEGEIFFLKEAGILAHLKHPRIVNFFCCGNEKETGNRFIAMELMEKSLFKLIEDQKNAYFSIPIVVDLMVQMARGMCYLHDRGVAHRDLKPQNVVVNTLTYPHVVNHYSVKLVDFGMSKTKVKVSKFNTMSAFGIGTTRYKAPEVYSKAHLDGKGKTTWSKADVFSFAMTIAHVLSLKVPFGGTKISEVYHELISGQRPELPEYCPRELVGLLENCWNTTPTSRPCFIEICTRLETFQHKLLRGIIVLDQDSQEEVDYNEGFEFIEAMIKEQSLIQKPSVDDNADDEVEVIHLAEVEEVEDEVYDLNEIERNDLVSIIPCICGRPLKFLPQVPGTYNFPYSNFGRCMCDICQKNIDGELYHCETCQFDAHRDCAEIKVKVNVFSHGDPLHILVQNYYENNPDVICDFCGESLQDSEWVYNCKQCNFNVHALCTKHPWKMNLRYIHCHPLTLDQSPLRKNASCRCCNGGLKRYRYTCTQKLCSFDVHPLCTILRVNPLCIFDRSHRLHLCRFNKRGGFHCCRCGGLGLSWFYACVHCDVDIHLDCVIDIEEEYDWNGVYEQFMLEYENKVDHDKMDTILELLDMLFISNGLGSSSSSMPTPVIMRVQPTVQTPTSSEAHNSNAGDDVNFQRKIGAETEERKAKRMATKEARQKERVKLKAEQGAKLENLERLLQDLQSSKIDAGVFAGAHEKLRKLQDFVQEVIASKMRQVPRIGLVFDWSAGNKLLTQLQVGEWGVRLVLLCEEPGHEHIVRLQGRSGVSGYHINDMDREQLEKLQPLLASGLQVVRMALSQATHITDLDCATLPVLGEEPWDLGAIDSHDIQTKMASEDKENIKLQKMAEDTAAESLRRYLEDNGISIFDTSGLLRVQYTVTEQDDRPRYTRGMVAWLCSEHQNRGLQAGILESYPLRIYHNLEYDQQRQFL